MSGGKEYFDQAEAHMLRDRQANTEHQKDAMVIDELAFASERV